MKFKQTSLDERIYGSKSYISKHENYI